MKKNNNIEMKIYEILGVKIFRKIVLKISDFCLKKLLTKEEQEDFSKNTTNYKMGKVSDLDDIKKYKKQMYFNAIIHIIGTFLGLLTFSYKIGFFNTLFNIISFSILVPPFFILLNLFYFLIFLNFLSLLMF